MDVGKKIFFTSIWVFQVIGNACLVKILHKKENNKRFPEYFQMQGKTTCNMPINVVLLR